jgi:hypothetical protein
MPGTKSTTTLETCSTVTLSGKWSLGVSRLFFRTRITLISPLCPSDAMEELDQHLVTRQARTTRPLTGYIVGTQFRVRLSRQLAKKSKSALQARGTVTAYPSGSQINLVLSLPWPDLIVFSSVMATTFAFGAVGIVLLLYQVLTRALGEISSTAWGLGLIGFPVAIGLLLSQRAAVPEPNPELLIAELKKAFRVPEAH